MFGSETIVDRILDIYCLLGDRGEQLKIEDILELSASGCEVSKEPGLEAYSCELIPENTVKEWVNKHQKTARRNCVSLVLGLAVAHHSSPDDGHEFDREFLQGFIAAGLVEKCCKYIGSPSIRLRDQIKQGIQELERSTNQNLEAYKEGNPYLFDSSQPQVPQEPKDNSHVDESSPPEQRLDYKNLSFLKADEQKSIVPLIEYICEECGVDSSDSGGLRLALTEIIVQESQEGVLDIFAAAINFFEASGSGSIKILDHFQVVMRFVSWVLSVWAVNADSDGSGLEKDYLYQLDCSFSESSRTSKPVNLVLKEVSEFSTAVLHDLVEDEGVRWLGEYSTLPCGPEVENQRKDTLLNIASMLGVDSSAVLSSNQWRSLGEFFIKGDISVHRQRFEKLNTTEDIIYNINRVWINRERTAPLRFFLYEAGGSLAPLVEYFRKCNLVIPFVGWKEGTSEFVLTPEVTDFLATIVCLMNQRLRQEMDSTKER